MRQDQTHETCQATIEQTSQLHGARYRVKCDYPSLMSAIGHNDPHQTYTFRAGFISTLLKVNGY